MNLNNWNDIHCAHAVVCKGLNIFQMLNEINQFYSVCDFKKLNPNHAEDQLNFFCRLPDAFD